MALHNESGRNGEKQAVDYLRRQGMWILEENWRHGHREMDIIAKEGDTLVFVEVKSRSSIDYGHPASFVDYRKQRLLIRVADAYLRRTGFEGEIRFDIVSVYLKENRIEHIRDAFWSN